jgi:hypothetical protein
MPCRSDYLEPSGQELESKRVCDLIIYLGESVGGEIPAWIREAAEDYYGNVERLDEATKILCARIRLLDEGQMEQLVYNGRSKQARRLAGWWERHQEWDARRVKEERETRKRIVTRERALRKLTPAEIEALGLGD